jgi:hypothetical protein
MNLMLADVINARNTLAMWGIPPDKISAGWHEGEMSLIIEYDGGDDMLEDNVLNVIETLTSTTLPIVLKKPDPTFKFNFGTAP